MAIACNCTGDCRSPAMGGKGRCPNLGPALPLPVCSLCGDAWQAGHDCTAHDATSGCPCRPENGGSGICGCVMGGLQVRC